MIVYPQPGAWLLPAYGILLMLFWLKLMVHYDNGSYIGHEVSRAMGHAGHGSHRKDDPFTSVISAGDHINASSL